MRKNILTLALLIPLTACANTETIRTSADTLLIHTSAAPVCGTQGALKVAQKMAAIETIKSGYDSYIIFNGGAQNNVSTSNLPGTYYTNGYVSGNSNFASYSGTSYYQPGATIYSGSNDAAFHIKMFKKGKKTPKEAIPAREVLGADWQKMVESGVSTCSN